MNACCILMISIIIQVDSVVSDTNGFISFCLQPLMIRGETQFIKAFANYTMLTQNHPPTLHGASLPAETQTDLIPSDPKTPNARFNGRTSTHRLFKKDKNYQNISSEYDVTHQLDSLHGKSSPISCLRGLLWQMMIVISFPCRYARALSNYDTWTKRHWVFESLIKLNHTI